MFESQMLSPTASSRSFAFAASLWQARLAAISCSTFRSDFFSDSVIFTSAGIGIGIGLFQPALAANPDRSTNQRYCLRQLEFVG